MHQSRSALLAALCHLGYLSITEEKYSLPVLSVQVKSRAVLVVSAHCVRERIFPLLTKIQSV